MTLLYSAQEPLFDKHGSRTHEHWVKIDEGKNMFVYSYGDERGIIDSKASVYLDDLLSDAIMQSTYYKMDVEIDLINKKPNEKDEKEVVQFT